MRDTSLTKFPGQQHGTEECPLFLHDYRLAGDDTCCCSQGHEREQQIAGLGKDENPKFQARFVPNAHHTGTVMTSGIAS